MIIKNILSKIILNYMKSGLTFSEISSVLGCSITGLKKHCKKLNITRITIYPSSFSNNELSILVGGLFGDSYLGKNETKREKYARLTIKHGPKQKEYAQFKLNALNKWTTTQEVTQTKNNQFVFRTISHPLFSELHPKFYQGKTKIVTPEALNMIDELALAIWICDDGCLARKDKYVLSTQSFTYNENKQIQEWFWEKFKIGCRINTDSTGKNILCFYGRQADILSNIIKPHMPPSMHYKIIQIITPHYTSKEHFSYE